MSWDAGGTPGVCVLGMLRTGTSAVAGILNLLGVHFGPRASLLGANRANPAGFWEHRGIIALNDDVLERLGGTWYEPPELPTGWETASAVGDLRKRARALLESELVGSARWGWKDPRTCLTLPLWQGLGHELTYVVCMRHPLDSARSLAALPWAQERLATPLEQSVELWLRFTQSALGHTEGRPRLVVFYDDLVEDHSRQARRLAGFVGLERALASREVEEAMAAFARPALRHHRDSGTRADAAGRAAARALQLYDRLRGEPA